MFLNYHQKKLIFNPLQLDLILKRGIIMVLSSKNFMWATATATAIAAGIVIKKIMTDWEKPKGVGI